MANQEQLEILKQGVDVWINWREENPDIKINLENVDLSETDLLKVNLFEANLSGANLKNANLKGAKLNRACFEQANLHGAVLVYANLNEANLINANLESANLEKAKISNANLQGADLYEANLTLAQLNGSNLINTILTRADLKGANLMDADLSGTILVNANLLMANVEGANISNSSVYGVNVWDLRGEFKEQNQLVISSALDEAKVTVDNIKVAQFIYLILNNREIQEVLNTLTSKTVLILGRFALPERKVILDSLRNKLREYDLLPIVFDFERPDDKDFTETVKTLAGICYFVIADVTNPKSSPLELQATVPDYQIPFVPIIQEGERPFAMMVDLQKKYDWVLDTISYKDGDQLIRVLKKGIIDRAMKKHDELRLIKAQIPTVISASQFEE